MNSGGETDPLFYLGKLWMKFFCNVTCRSTGTVLPVVACHTSSLPVQVFLLSARYSCFHCIQLNRAYVVTIVGPVF